MATAPDIPATEGAAESELDWRMRQQLLQADFGLTAFRCANRQDLLDAAVRAASDGMNTRLAKFLEPHPEKPDQLLVRAGVGWHDGVVGRATVGCDTASPAGYAFQTGQPVISNHFDAETRFRTPALFVEHGVTRALNVVVRDGDEPFGVLEVDRTDAREFGRHDIAFMEGLATVLAVSLERQRTDADLSQTLEREKLLVHEMRHRVKNLFSVVNGILSISEREARRAGTPEDAIEYLRARITALARSSEIGLTGSDDAGGQGGADPVALSRSVLAPYSGLVEVTGSVEATVPARMVTPVSLLLHELATNSVKHGALGAEDGTVALSWQGADHETTFRWTENGGPEITGEPTAQGFGTSLVRSIIASAGGTIRQDWRATGLEVTVCFPGLR